ncbi:hypothetical protein JD969_09990 [Planctomycetota bacterium]|nr:hypothetical protein JD969_09990 [Planctomycetota bacterium]
MPEANPPNPVSSLNPPAYCQKCHYPIAHLRTYNCPECGHFFDPTDPHTYHKFKATTHPLTTFFLLAIAFSLPTFCIPIFGLFINLFIIAITIPISIIAVNDPYYKNNALAIATPIITLFFTLVPFLFIYFLISI